MMSKCHDCIYYHPKPYDIDNGDCDFNFDDCPVERVVIIKDVAVVDAIRTVKECVVVQTEHVDHCKEYPHCEGCDYYVAPYKLWELIAMSEKVEVKGEA